MSNENFTPGPWEADCRMGVFVVRRKGDRLQCLSGSSDDSIVYQDGRSEEKSSPQGYHYLTDEQIANANLIAAAPEMYEFINWIRSVQGQCAIIKGKKLLPQILDKADEVLKKVRGK